MINSDMHPSNFSIRRDLVGVDACKQGWVAVHREASSGQIECYVFKQFQQLIREMPADSIIAVDIPIGMSADGYRQCDTEVRAHLGAKRSSVFYTPVLAVLQSLLVDKANRYERAKDLSRQAFGKALSIQAMSIVPKINEVRTVLLASRSARERVFEVHPELCFAALRQLIFGGGLAGVMSKKAMPEGRKDRYELLSPVFADYLDKAMAERAKKLKGAEIDDLLDAFVCLWSCERIAAGQDVALPSGPPLLDPDRLPMAIRY